MDAALIVSLVAVAIALFTLGWQLWRARWEQPVVVVAGVMFVQEDGVKLRAVVSNIGDRPVTLIMVGWILSRFENGRVQGWTGPADASEFPYRLDAHDTRSWDFPVGQQPSADSPGEPYARIVQRPTWWEARRGVQPERTILGALGAHMSPE